MQKKPSWLFFRRLIRSYPAKINFVIVLLLLTTSSFSAGSRFETSWLPGNPYSEFQQNAVSGIVLDSKGEPIIGATVSVKGSTLGALTDINGRYSIANVPANSVLTFSFIGMTTQEIPLEGKSAINVTLVEATLALDEVVVIGYGTQKKETSVGAVSQMSSDQIMRTGNVTDLRQALGGQIPGVLALQVSGEPGGITTGNSATNIFIRGQNTWNGGQPLVLVDGVERNMNNIDPSEVASISVLKDASATAVFGVKGANGVILITTKRGSVGKTTLNFNYTATSSMLSKQPKKLDSYAAMMAKNEIIEREGVLNEPSWDAYVPYDIVTRYKLPQTPEYAYIYPNVDWEDAMFKTMGLSHRATLSAQGGSKAVQYFGSLAYINEGDMFTDYNNLKGYDANYDYNRFNFRSNIDIKLTKTTKFSLDLAGYFSQKNTNYNNEGSTSRADAWMWRATYGLAPNLFLPMYEDGRWGTYQEGGNNTVNPLAMVYNLGVRQTRTTQLNSNFTLDQDLGFITKGLNARVTMFYDNSIRSEGGIYDVNNHGRANEAATNIRYTQIYPMLYEGPEQDPSEYTLYLPVSDEEYNWVLRPWTIRDESVSSGANFTSGIPVDRRMMYQAQINYARKFGVHNVMAMGLFKREQYANGSMFQNFREDWVFRATYDYKSKYLFEANGAYNGSEQFGPGYRFDFFPSVALGWVISNEDFWKNVRTLNFINKFKVRYSRGKIGDDKVSGSRWLYESQFSYGGRAGLNEVTNALSPYYMYRQSNIGNPDVHWETAIKNNLGFELGFLKNVISLNVEVYNEDRTGILLDGESRNIPPFFGATPPAANLGRVKSNGFEMMAGFNKDITRDLRIWADFTFAHNENKILERDDLPLQFDHLKQKGFPIGQQRSLIKTEFYDNWDEVYASIPTENNDMAKLPGYYDLIDFNADGLIKSSEDTPPIGYSEIPQNTASITLGGAFRGLSLMVQFYGVNNANRQISFNNFVNDTDVLFEHVNDYWSKENQDATSFLPRWKTNGENIGNYYQYDASYIRLKVLELAYSFNNNAWAKKVGFSNLRIFLNGNNLFFWSKLPDDREQTYSGGSATEGAYPTVKRVNLGIDLTF
jgi:TonB-linked SusC/RagA family outer membrane protein